MLVRHKKLRYIVFLVAVALVVLMVVVLVPKEYAGPVFEPRPATQYWKMDNGSSIGYTVISKRMEKKPYPVLYLHGGPGGHITNGDIDALRPLADLGYRVYLYDQIGSGHSDRLAKIGEYSVQRHMNDLRGIIKKLGASKVILIGQSWGAILATLFAAEHPELVHRMVLTSPGPIYPVQSQLASLPPPDSIRLKEPVYSNVMGNRQANNWRTKAMKMMATAFHVKLASDKEADQFVTFLNQQVNRSTVCDTSRVLGAEAGSGYYASVMTFTSLLEVKDPRPKIRKLETRVLVMKGECDNQKWGYTQEYLQLFRHSQFQLVPGAGHFIDVERPKEYTDAIMAFLKED